MKRRRLVVAFGMAGAITCVGCANDSPSDTTGTGASAGQGGEGGLGGAPAGGNDVSDGGLGGMTADNGSNDDNGDETKCLRFDEESDVDPMGMIVVNEVYAGSNNIDIPRDYIELYNRGDVCLDLEGYYLHDTFPPGGAPYLIPAGVTAQPGEFVLFSHTEHFQFGLSQGGEGVELFAPDGTMLDASHWQHQEADVSWGRYPDGAGDVNDNDAFTMLEEQTPGAANASPLARSD